MPFVGCSNVVTNKARRRHFEYFEVSNPPWEQMRNGKNDYITKRLIEIVYMLQESFHDS